MFGAKIKEIFTFTYKEVVCSKKHGLNFKKPFGEHTQENAMCFTIGGQIALPHSWEWALACFS